MSLKSFNAVVHGLVQGVFFRKEASDVASQLGLTGWARNLPDGNVEVWAEGEENQLEQFQRWLDKGPPLARVSRVDIKWRKPTGEYDSFVIRR